jgi:hypothetical protein
LLPPLVLAAPEDRKNGAAVILFTADRLAPPQEADPLVAHPFHPLVKEKGVDKSLPDLSHADGGFAIG